MVKEGGVVDVDQDDGEEEGSVVDGPLVAVAVVGAVVVVLVAAGVVVVVVVGLNLATGFYRWYLQVLRLL